MESLTPEALVETRHLRKRFVRSGARSQNPAPDAVRDVSLHVCQGETLGIVGESGCGKSTLGRMLVGLLPPTGGEVLVSGKPLYNPAAHEDYRAFRKNLAGVVQMVFQDPQSSLNPRMRVGESVAEPLRCSFAWRAGEEGSLTERCIQEKAMTMLEEVGLSADAAKRYPHEFSGGQRQRIAIARALVTRPSFVVCDEPTSSLDASVQSQVLNLLGDMQQALGLAYCFISHDLAVVRHMSDRVAVMYNGLVVEEGPAEALFAAPLHPYTRLLLDSVPGTATRQEEAAKLHGATSVAEGPGGQKPQGCPFVPRCARAMPVCRENTPALVPWTARGEAGAAAFKNVPADPAGSGRSVRCALYPAELA
ncbi:ABC transporter ATP-binding protein [Desulfovibrio sp. OttesenSCG-928-G15]|nr:ABC transporter ATP-binding protein [Desulfovibrio sp. OttesenSCG-928-G15]